MKSQKVVVILAQLGALALAGCASFSSVDSDNSNQPTWESSLSEARVIYVAETHNDPAHHRLEESIIRSLHRRGQSMTVGLEMVDVTQQSALNQYLEKKISWTTFARSTEFESGWGKTSPAYKRILEWCRRNQVPVVGLNAPHSVTRKIARNQKLTSAEFELIPKFPEPPGGFQKFQAAMAGHSGSGSIRRVLSGATRLGRHDGRNNSFVAWKQSGHVGGFVGTNARRRENRRSVVCREELRCRSISYLSERTTLGALQ